MRIVTIEEKKIALELDWNTLDYENKAKAIKQLQADQKTPGSRSGIVLENSGQIVVGLSDVKGTVKEPSGAGWLAQANKIQNEEMLKSDMDHTDINWIVIENLGVSETSGGQEEYWFSVIQDGLPLPGADVILSWDDMSRNLSLLIQNQGMYTVFSKDERILNAFSSQANIHPKGFWNLVSEVKFRAKIKPLNGVPPALAIGIIVIFVMVLAYFGYSHYEDAKRLRESQAAQTAAQAQQAAQASQAAQNYKKEVSKTIETNFKSGLDDINSSLSQGDPSSTLLSWAQIIGTIPLDHAGWLMNNIQCDVNNRIPECTIKLSRGNFGINRNLVEKFPNVQFDGDNAFYVIRGAQLPVRDNHIQNIIGGRTFSLGLLSDLQTLRVAGIQYSLTSSSEIIKSLTLPPKPAISIKKKEKPATYEIQYGVASGSLSLQGNQLWQIKDLSQYLDSPILVLKGVTLTISPNSLEQAPWTLSFAYFVRTAPYPTIPAIPDAQIVGGYIDPVSGKMVDPNKPGDKKVPDFTPGGVQSSTVSSTQSNPSESQGLSAPTQGLPQTH